VDYITRRSRYDCKRPARAHSVLLLDPTRVKT
jgi:hypothetical protein